MRAAVIDEFWKQKRQFPVWIITWITFTECRDFAIGEAFIPRMRWLMQDHYREADERDAAIMAELSRIPMRPSHAKLVALTMTGVK